MDVGPETKPCVTSHRLSRPWAPVRTPGCWWGGAARIEGRGGRGGEPGGPKERVVLVWKRAESRGRSVPDGRRGAGLRWGRALQPRPGFAAPLLPRKGRERKGGGGGLRAGWERRGGAGADGWMNGWMGGGRGGLSRRPRRRRPNRRRRRCRCPVRAAPRGGRTACPAGAPGCRASRRRSGRTRRRTWPRLCKGR